MGADRRERILLAVDGEPYTDQAVGWALELALGLGMELAAVHFRDPYLKQFHNEIYAQGREEYLEHVDLCLDELARRAEEALQAAVAECLGAMDPPPDLVWSFEVLDGDPTRQLAELVDHGGISLIVLGRRPRQRPAALRSRDLGERLSSLPCSLPVLVVPGI